MKFNGIINNFALLSKEEQGLGGGGSGGGSGRSDEQFNDERLEQLQAAYFAQHSNIVESVNADTAEEDEELARRLESINLTRTNEATAYLSALQAYASIAEEIKLEEIAKIREHIVNLKSIIVNSPDGADTDKLDVYYRLLEQTTKLIKESMEKELALFKDGITEQGKAKTAIHNNYIKQHELTLKLIDILLETTGPEDLDDTSGNYLGSIDEDVYTKYLTSIESLKAEYEESITVLSTDLIDDTEVIGRRKKKLKTSQDSVSELSEAIDNVATKEKTKYISGADYYNMWQYIEHNGIAIPLTFDNKNREESEKFISICEKAMGLTPSTNIKSVGCHKIVKHLKRYFKPGEDGEDGKYVSPYSNDQIEYNGAEGKITVAEGKKIVEVAKGYVSTVLNVDNVYFVRKQSSQDRTMWWYDKLPPRAQVLVSAIDSWKRCIGISSHSEGSKIKARHAIKELVKAGMCEESNKDVYDRFLDETNRDKDNVKTRDWYATVMLLALGVKESEIHQNKRCFNNSDEFFTAANNMYTSMDKEFHDVLDFLAKGMQETWFKEFDTQERRELLNKILLATASDTSIASMQLMNILVEAGVECPCYACEGKEPIISALRDWEHPNEDARKLKSKIGKNPSRYSIEQLLQHFEKDEETDVYKILLLMPCQWAHRQKDLSGLSRKAAGEQVEIRSSFRRQMHKRLLYQLDEKLHSETVLGGHIVSMRQSAGADRHHPTEKKYACVCDEAVFEILEMIKDVAKLVAEIEERISNGEITKHDTAKKDDISTMIHSCTDITRLITVVLAEYYKTRLAMCIDHRLITRVMEKEDCMRIFGLINPCIVTEKYIIIKREWIEKMKNNELDAKSLFVRETTDEEIKTKVEELEQKLDVPDRWADINKLLDIEKLVHQMNRMSPSIYKTELTKLRQMEN